MANSTLRQDLPPEGGYAKIVYQRIPPKRNWMLFAGYVGISMLGFNMWFRQKGIYFLERLEKYDSLIAIEPFYKAEQDRAFLKHLRRSREEERELMKDVPGWKVGTLFGEPVWKSLPEGKLPNLIIQEYYAHTRPFDSLGTTWYSRWL